MTKRTSKNSGRIVSAWTGAALVGSVMVGFGLPGAANAADMVRIGLATKTWFPTVVAHTAEDQGYFKDEGIEAELTVYQSGAEAVTAMVAGAADIIGSSSSVTASSRAKGVDAKLIGMLGSGNYGWQLMVLPNSPITEAKQVEGENVGITSAGSLSDMLARWTMSDQSITFESIPLGGGGLLPNLISENVSAAVVYSPLSYDVLTKGDARAILDYGTAMPEHLNSGWATTGAFIEEKPELVQKATNALYRGVAYLQDNKDAAIKIIADLNNISPEVAEMEWKNVFLKLSRTGEMNADLAATAMDLAKLTGIEDMPQADEIWTDAFTPAVISPAK